MTSLQAVDPYPRSYYVATATGMLPAPPLQADRRADVCIVGGGFTGVATALHLAERGYQAVVVEAQRLGWGAGFYDRTLAALRDRKTVTAVGIAFAAQEVDNVPHGPHDQRLDWMVTESEAIRTGT